MCVFGSVLCSATSCSQSLLPVLCVYFVLIPVLGFYLTSKVRVFTHVYFFVLHAGCADVTKYVDFHTYLCSVFFSVAALSLSLSLSLSLRLLRYYCFTLHGYCIRYFYSPRLLFTVTVCGSSRPSNNSYIITFYYKIDNYLSFICLSKITSFSFCSVFMKKQRVEKFMDKKSGVEESGIKMS